MHALSDTAHSDLPTTVSGLSGLGMMSLVGSVRSIGLLPLVVLIPQPEPVMLACLGSRLPHFKVILTSLEVDFIPFFLSTPPPGF